MSSINDIDKATVYSNGLCYCSVCSPFGSRKTEKIVNVINPTGSSSSEWKVSRQKFASGETSPCSCNNKKKRQSGYRHYLCVC